MIKWCQGKLVPWLYVGWFEDRNLNFRDTAEMMFQ